MLREKEISLVVNEFADMVANKFLSEEYGIRSSQPLYNRALVEEYELRKFLLDRRKDCHPKSCPKYEDYDVTDIVRTKDYLPEIVCYQQDQETLANQWVIDHELGFNPEVTVTDPTGRVIFGTVNYLLDGLTLQITFTDVYAGTAYLFHKIV